LFLRLGFEGVGQFVPIQPLAIFLTSLPLPTILPFMEEKTNEMTEQNTTEVNNTAFSANINTDENIAGVNHLNEQIAEETELEKLKEAVEEEKKKYLYLMAEFDNFRRRTAKERVEQMQTAGKEVIVSMLEVLDDADRAEAELSKNGGVDEGVKLVFHKLRSTLQNRGLKAMETKGQDFDADKHEAITEIPVPNEELKGKVIDEIEKGYLLNDKIIRFAKVVVGK
jgi:molecular chaperone GrpE